MNTLVSTLVQLTGASLMGALIYATVKGGKALHDWLAQKGQTSALFREAMVLEDLAQAIVQDVEANEKAALEARDPSKPLSAADYSTLKSIAMDRLKAVLKARGMDTMKNMLGALTETPTQLDAVLSGKIEQAVAKVGVASALSSAVSSPK
jgi:hypothetical protein